MLDSECTISTLETSASQLKPFFHNRRAEILENIDSVSKFCEMEPVHWVRSEENIADILTRGTAKLSDLGPGSVWQSGPTFLSCRRERWPVHRDFIRTELPRDEMRTGKAFLRIAALAVKVGEDKKFPALFKSIETVLLFDNNLEARKRVIARLMNGWSAKSKEEASAKIKGDPVAIDLQKAEKMILVHAMIETAEAFEKGQLLSLMPFRSGKLIVTRGRLGEKSLEAILGVSELPILMSNTRVAELFMWRAHVGYSGLLHRSVVETLARSRSSVWIVKGKLLAKKICNQCMECRKERKKLMTQQIVKLREESSKVCPTWTRIALDYAGSIVLKGEVNQRSRGKSKPLVKEPVEVQRLSLLVPTEVKSDEI